MLFNSFAFLFGFLPVALLGFFLIARASRQAAALWLAACSLFFYGWWNPKFVTLLLASIAWNYVLGYLIGHARSAGMLRRAGTLLVVAISANLLLLSYYKYANFFLGAVAGSAWSAYDIVIPLGISFFTFTQIAFLVDVYRGIAREYRFVHYLLFVTYFPHLIAGPLLHHAQMMPQFGWARTYRPDWGNVGIGLGFLAIGLFKKVVLADEFALLATPGFATAAAGAPPAFYAAWTSALAYTLQLYFDFSGYTDMAIGISRMFNVKLPRNFWSPYKATSIVDFWRRWHITLSTFLRDYLYIPLGGNRLGSARRYANLLVTMVLGGLWHGANWTFVVWGLLHGIYLVVNHGWRAFVRRFAIPSVPGARYLGIALTFLAVVVGWVYFRADSIQAAHHMLLGMAGFSEIRQPTIEKLVAAKLAIGLAIVFFAPNAYQLVAAVLRKVRRLRERGLAYGAVAWRAGFAVGILYFLVFKALRPQQPSPFLYFNF